MRESEYMAERDNMDDIKNNYGVRAEEEIDIILTMSRSLIKSRHQHFL